MSEAVRVQTWIKQGTRLPPDEYRRRMIAMFTAYGQDYKTLAKEYDQYANIKFYDIRNAFEDLAKPAYQDLIHYTPAGQKRLAERMYQDLQTVDLVREHSVQEKPETRPSASRQ
jgi:lysophospholipase L1-like esterase